MRGRQGAWDKRGKIQNRGPVQEVQHANNWNSIKREEKKCNDRKLSTE